MVTFVCYFCDQTLKKKQLNTHQYSCGSPCKFICIDCRQTFVGEEHKAHTSCMTEKEKYWGQYKNGVPQKKNQNQQNQQQQQKQQQQQQQQLQQQQQNKKEGEEKVIKKQKQNTKEQREIQVLKNEFLGWKKEIRKYLKKENKQVKIKSLRKQLVALYLENKLDSDKEQAKKIFNEKIQNKKYQISEDNKYISFA